MASYTTPTDRCLSSRRSRSADSRARTRTSSSPTSTTWFPKITGRMLSESLGELSFWFMFVGFNLTFLIQHAAGLSGMPRRIYDYSEELGVSGYNLISTIGSFILGIGVVMVVANLLWSIKHGRRAGNDPWKGNTLGGSSSRRRRRTTSTSSPRVRSLEPMKDIRREVLAGVKVGRTVATPVAPQPLTLRRRPDRRRRGSIQAWSRCRPAADGRSRRRSARPHARVGW
jgi:hypothetical protein